MAVSQVHIVIGAGYGDEGKGTTVHNLVSGRRTFVMRFNGGAQAGHTVETDLTRHVFSHFGSGSLNHANTLLSKYFVVNPILFNREAKELEKLNRFPSTSVDPECLITTLSDMVINVELETHRGNNRHGSVGVGFGETIERSLHEEFRLTMNDIGSLTHEELTNKLLIIRQKWVPIRLNDLGITTISPDARNILSNLGSIQKFVLDSDKMHYKCNDESLERSLRYYDISNLIFEGAQGLMLDQDMGFKPHVTRSNTGLKNVVSIIDDEKDSFLYCKKYVYYVTRAYTTRHGAGPFPHELPEAPYSIVDKTNVTNEFQGPMRYSYLNFDSLRYAIENDKKYATDDMVIGGIITCCDQLEGHEVKYILEHKTYTAKDIYELVDIYSDIVGGAVTMR